MTTLTKVFVILVCMFAFVFTPTAIMFARRTYDWKAVAENSLLNAENAQAAWRSALAYGASEAQHYKTLRDKELERLRVAEDEIARLQDEIARLTRERDDIRLSAQNLEDATKLLTAELQVANGQNQKLGDANKRLSESELRLQDESRRLTAAVNELTAEKIILQEQVNKQKQEITAYSNENERLRQQYGLGAAREPETVSPAPGVQPVTPASAAPIRGEVTEVRGNLVTVNIGSSSGLQKGMTMVVLRGGDGYVCDLKITGDVTPTEAVGEVQLSGGKRVRSGDQVIDEISFNQR